MNGFFTTAAFRCKRSLWFLFPGLFPPSHSHPGSRCARAAFFLTAIALLALWLPATRADARTLEVGPTRKLTSPEAAAAVAHDGDRVIIDSGIYRGCAVWTASRLIIEARRPPSSMQQTVMNQAVVTGPACADRALFLFTGNDIVVVGLTFVHARDTAHNGAGILMEGANLTVENSQFLDNENGILAGGPPVSVVRIGHSLFRGNGSCESACAHSVYAGRPIARLEVTACTFLDTHIAHNIKSRARSTIVRDSRIEDGPTGTSSYLIELPNGGDALIVNNTLQKGARSDNKEVAISIGGQNISNPTTVLDIRGNRFTSDLPELVRFVRNTTATPARLRDNTLVGHILPLEGPGTAE